LKTVRELIYKRGYGKVDKQRIPLSQQRCHRGNLGKFDILCVEDLVHEIFTAGPNFKQVVVPYSDIFNVWLLILYCPGIQLPMAIQALQPHWWLEDTEVQALRPGW
jgi:hypothetical protein